MIYGVAFGILVPYALAAVRVFVEEEVRNPEVWDRYQSYVSSYSMKSIGIAVLVLTVFFFLFFTNKEKRKKFVD